MRIPVVPYHMIIIRTVKPYNAKVQGDFQSQVVQMSHKIDVPQMLIWPIISEFEPQICSSLSTIIVSQRIKNCSIFDCVEHDQNLKWFIQLFFCSSINGKCK